MIKLFYLFLAFTFFAVPHARADEFSVTIQGKKFRVGARISSTRKSDVFQAVDENGNRVAIKFYRIRPEEEVASLEYREQLESTSARGKLIGLFAAGPIEARTIRFTDRDRDRAMLAMVTDAKGAVVMERVDGDVNHTPQYLRLGPGDGAIFTFKANELAVRVDTAFLLTTQLSELWAGMAEKGLLYGDFKPENIGFTGPPLTFKLLDLGSLVPGPIRSEDPYATRKKLMGTYEFHAPEMSHVAAENALPGHVYNHLGDYYAIGKTLRDSLCGGCSPDKVDEMILAYAKEFPGPENEATISKLLFISEVIRGSLVHLDVENRERTIVESPILSKYFGMKALSKPGAPALPKISLSHAEAAQLARPSMQATLQRIETQLLAREPEWKTKRYQVTDVLAQPGEKFPPLYRGGQIPSGRGGCGPGLVFLGATLLTTGMGLTAVYFSMEKDAPPEKKAPEKKAPAPPVFAPPKAPGGFIAP